MFAHEVKHTYSNLIRFFLFMLPISTIAMLSVFSNILYFKVDWPLINTIHSGDMIWFSEKTQCYNFRSIYMWSDTSSQINYSLTAPSCVHLQTWLQNKRQINPLQIYLGGEKRNIKAKSDFWNILLLFLTNIYEGFPIKETFFQRYVYSKFIPAKRQETWGNRQKTWWN